ncbi:hypothetical protein N7492_006642 [Penicillium capsulatum]|uniref:Uncharacterized protein n=1 Tax=Penicillium capsulatum TaxID=69766 RepID=A0A9W9I1S5_9EURO|nr:hypothetical protein N7492_006642 [Penicillium capsulatum]KAJ6116477.1 hypothetical protein N7512_006202 [Penicillium capsulatum]
MKEPFQLMLPSSPASCDSAPTFPKTPKRQSRPPAGHSLRTWRSDQNLTSTNLAALGLLPSPPMSESRPASTGPDTSYIHREEPREDGLIPQDAAEKATEEAPGESPANPPPGLTEEPQQPMHAESLMSLEERMNYQAYRPPGWQDQQTPDQRLTDVKNVHEAHSNLLRQCESANADKTPTRHDRKSSPVKSCGSSQSGNVNVSGNSPKPQRPRTATVSSEASWIPSNLSYCERWLQGVPLDPQRDKEENPKTSNRRKFQIVEKDPPMLKPDDNPGAKALQQPVVRVQPLEQCLEMDANFFCQRLAVASKPKLVDIARQSSPSMPPPPSPLPQPVPMTPDQRQEEVSAFSPDTPLDMSDSGYGTRESGYSLDSYTGIKDDDTYTDPGSLTSDSVSSTVVCERSDCAQGERATSPQPEIRSGSVSPQASSPIHDSPRRRSDRTAKAEVEKQTPWQQEWTHDDHEWTLDELDHSVKDFPRHMLRLTSPVIVFLRKNDENALLRPFRTIFPEVAENLLDCLCAALIARNYLLSLSIKHRHKPSLSTRHDMYAVDAVPTKAYSTLGIQLPSGSPGRIKDRVLGSRSLELRRELERIVDNLLFAISGRSDETLKSAVEVLAEVLET